MLSGWGPVWAATGSALGGFPVLPDIDLTIFGDRDEAGRTIALKCAARWGVRARILLPPAGRKDWNEAWAARR